MRRALSLLVAAAAALVAASQAIAAPGDLDTTFANGGKLAFTIAQAATADAVAIQPDDKIVLAGVAKISGTDSDIAVTRLNSDGSFDTGFGNGGSRTVNVSTTGGQSFDFPLGVALQPDGKIVVGGASVEAGALATGKGLKMTLVRLDSQGNLDPSFGDGSHGPGIAQPGPGFVADLAVQADGKVVFAGANDDSALGGEDSSDFVIGRLGSDGKGDPTFGPPVTVDFKNDDHAAGLALQPDGRILAAGTSNINNKDSDVAVVRVTPGSGVDPTFGKFVYGYAPFSTDSGSDLVLQPDGAVDVSSQADDQHDFVLARFSSAGNPIRWADGTQVTFADFPGDGQANAIALQQNGKMVLAGFGAGSVALARFQPGGALDDTFGTGGERTVDFPAGASDGRDVAIDSAGRIVVVGAAAQFAVVARLQGDAVSAGGGPGGGSPGGGGGGGGQRPSTLKVPRCGGKKATIVGTSGNDKLRGTRRSDVIAGLGGNDTISGGAGNDVICGGAGNDKISGGAGKDKLYGGAGRDRLNGGSGKDALNGGAGKDSCAGRDKKSSC
jgi:uncharacterized delta-60 repeat protein